MFKSGRHEARFLLALLELSSRPSWSLLGIFISGLLIVALTGNWVYDVCLDLNTFLTWGSLAVWITNFILLGIAYFLWLYHERKSANRAILDEYDLVEPHKGLIWILSPGDYPRQIVELSIAHHLPELTDVWMIGAYKYQNMADAYDAVEQLRIDQKWGINLHKADILEADAVHAHDKVLSIMTGLPDGLEPDDIVVDITGGLKPLTAGAAVACVINKWAMSYVESDRDIDGNPISGTQRPIALDAGLISTRTSQ